MKDQKRSKLIIKRVALVALAVFVLLILVTIGLSVFERVLKSGSKKPDALPSDVFYDADYEKSIFEYEPYMQLNRSVMYLEYDSGETLTEENHDLVGVASSFFYDYFDAIVRGDADQYRSMLTENYIRDFDPPSMFTMQMLYDIEVNRVQSSWKEKYKGKDATVYCFAVKYKIFENNGTFRNDIASNQSTTQYYEIYCVDGVFYLNSYTNKMVIPEE